MNKILILGGAGFIGTHLTERYLSEGDEVVIIDSLVTSIKPDSEVRFIESRGRI